MVLPIDCAVYDLFYGPETWRRRRRLQRRRQQAAAFATTIRGSVDFFERKENPTFLIQKDSCPQKALKDSLRTFQKEKKIFASTKGSKFPSFFPLVNMQKDATT